MVSGILRGSSLVKLISEKVARPVPGMRGAMGSIMIAAGGAMPREPVNIGAIHTVLGAGRRCSGSGSLVKRLSFARAFGPLVTLLLYYRAIEPNVLIDRTPQS